jgi:hypothetical protein
MMQIFVALALVLSLAPSARAQPAGAQAETLFREGRDLMTAGKIAEACAAFDESQKLDAAVTTLLNLAGCREKNSQLATAWGLFLEAERQTRGSNDDATKKLHEIAQARAATLEPRVSKLTINVAPASRVAKLEITRGAERIDEAMWNRQLPVDGGTYSITARAPNTADWSTQIVIAAERDTKTVDIPKLVVSAPATPVASQPPPPPPVAVVEKRSVVVPLVVGVGAVGLLGGGLAFDLSGSSTYDKAKAEMTSQSRRDSLYNSANTKRYVAESFAGAGVVAAGLAVWLFVRGGPDEASTTAVRLVPTVSGVALFGTY